MNDDNQKELLEHTAKRGAMIEDVSVVEELIGYFVSTHYFGRINTKFLEQVWEDEHFGIQLKKSVLKTILDEHYPGYKFPFKEFDELQGLRNIIAHARKKVDTTYYTDKEPTTGKAYYPFRGKKRDATELEKKFDDLCKKVTESVQNLPGMPFTKQLSPEEVKSIRVINGKPVLPNDPHKE